VVGEWVGLMVMGGGLEVDGVDEFLVSLARMG